MVKAAWGGAVLRMDLLINLGLLILILGSSALLTNAYVRRAYYRCAKCRNLNAKRRSRCRVCGTPLGSRSLDSHR